jgi:type IV fimbrial biogenesis protein FimT
MSPIVALLPPFPGKRLLRCPSESGFTVIELVMTVAILTVLLTIAAPSLSALVREQRIKSATFDLYASLIFARSEAIKRNRFVAICAMNADGSGCQNSSDWARGWIVFEDEDGNGFPAAVADILKRQDAIADLSVTGTASNVTYQRDGRLRADVADFVVSSPVDSSVAMRCVRVHLSGQPNVRVDADKSTAGCQ